MIFKKNFNRTILYEARFHEKSSIKPLKIQIFREIGHIWGYIDLRLLIEKPLKA